ncbi:MAG: GNAT family N-acetyltransferase [Lachnospiraceae bacterium]|nr:GNAT family N-acetyltransferase [Lachnospiraceae bacterium]
MKQLFLILKTFSHLNLEFMISDLKRNGIKVVLILVAGERLLTENGDDIKEEDSIFSGYDYVLTDCNAGILFACERNIGFVYYEAPQNKECLTKENKGLGFGYIKNAQCIIQGFEEIDFGFLEKMYERFKHLPWTILTTERLMIREMTVDDVDRLYEIYAAPEITEYTEPLYEDRNEEIAYTRSYIKNQYEFFGYGMWLVVEKSTGRIIGRVGLSDREGFSDSEIGYVIEKEKQNKGYATEACKAVIKYAKEKLFKKGLNCFIYRDNKVSERLCRNLGFEFMEYVRFGTDKMMRFYIDLAGNAEGDDIL